MKVYGATGEWECPVCKERITWSLDSRDPREVRAFIVTVEDEIRKHEATHEPAATQGTA